MIYKCILIFFGLIFFAKPIKSFEKPLSVRSDYTFVVAGHAYGSHYDTNRGLQPAFLQALSSKKVAPYEFIILTGDAVRNSTEEEFNNLSNILKKPFYLCMGNHEYSNYGRGFFKKKYGNDYYSFSKGTEKFIFLNSQEKELAISNIQINFLEEELNKITIEKNIFIFFHELLWNSRLKYKGINSNGRCRYENIKNKSNFWEEIFPLLEKFNTLNFYVIAGDVGGNPDAIPAYYEKIENIELIASGMGEIKDENILLISKKNNKIYKKLFSLNTFKFDSLEVYNLEFLKNHYSPSPKKKKVSKNKNITKNKYLSIKIIVLTYWKSLLSVFLIFVFLIFRRIIKDET
jgi:hypothetical protein